EHCPECNVDFFMIIRLKHHGQIKFCNINRQWPLSREQLVRTCPHVTVIR
ncbi:hypothetical protein ASPFODRAFT_148171, partial [Aspergillus luchuensis CBS 106.47]